MKIFFKFTISIIIIFFFIFSIYATGGEGDTIGEKISNNLINFGINPYLVILLIAMIPIVELRGSIPVGILFLKLNPIWVVVLSLIGNMIPIFFILFLFEILEKILRRFSFFDKIFNWLFARTMAKSKAIEKYQEIGLMVFVAIPAPLTGGWTGALIAYLLKLSYLKSIIFIFFGVLIAATVVTSLTLVLTTLSTFWQLLFFILIFIMIFIFLIINFIKKRINK